MLIGMLTRRVIVDEIDANFVADALAPEILVEVVVGHGKLRKKWPRGAANVPEQWTLPRSECRGLTSCPLRVLLDHASLLRLRAAVTRVATRRREECRRSCRHRMDYRARYAPCRAGSEQWVT